MPGVWPQAECLTMGSQKLLSVGNPFYCQAGKSHSPQQGNEDSDDEQATYCREQHSRKSRKAGHMYTGVNKS